MIGRLALLFLLVQNWINAAPHCCSLTETNAACRYECEQLSRSGTQVQQIKQIASVAEHCPSNLIEFWQCVKETVPVIKSLQVWDGQPCCELAKRRSCKDACFSVNSSRDLKDYCESDEMSLFSCLDRQSLASSCCSQAKSVNCYTICQSMYLNDELGSVKTKESLKLHCHATSPKVMSCVKDHSRTTRASNSGQEAHPCCSHASSKKCRDICRSIPWSETEDSAIVDKLISVCGAIKLNPMDQMWACFLASKGQKKPTTSHGIDGAKLQCCRKAKKDRCRNLCVKAYSKTSTNSWKDFDDKCKLFQPMSVMEPDMHKCLIEVNEPCKLGCDGLKYCTNFNNRPSELFRSCNMNADEAAQKDVETWKQGYISMELHEMRIPVKDIQTCEPDMWKAISCALQVKPCHRKPTALSICREDCVYLLSKCVDRTRFESHHTVEKLCDTLPSSTKNGSCISLSKYTRPSSLFNQLSLVTNPCNPSPCISNETCVINRRKCRHPDKCKPYKCKQACKMGRSSKVLVPKGSLVVIPVPKKNMLNCNELCKCGNKYSIDHCVPMKCNTDTSCMISEGHKKHHGDHFKLDCNHCVCHYGELVCTKHVCSSHSSQTVVNKLRCRCSSHYEPVCGANGKTYPNYCLAECSGLKQNEIVTSGHCNEVLHCGKNSCTSQQRCVPKRQTCLSTVSCKQYECIPINTSECNKHQRDPVCDTQGDEFTNLCLLNAHGKRLAYRGHCIKYCDNSRPVCGHNGETYKSECAAIADKTTVDYQGKCSQIGLSSGENFSIGCTKVICPQIRPQNCRPITPAGACCPVCAAELRVLFSQTAVENAVEANDYKPITVPQILEIFSNQITIAECDVYGYLDIDGELIFLVKSVVSSPNHIQIKACNEEAKRLKNLILDRSPLLVSYLSVSPLLYSSLREPYIMTSAESSAVINSYLSIQLVLTYILIFIINWNWDR